MPRPIVMIGVLLTVLQVGCGGDDVAVPQATRAAAPVADIAQKTGTSPDMAPTAYWSSQKLIRTAELQIEVKDVRRATQVVDSVVRRTGALVTESKSSQRARGRRDAQVVVRVPSDSLTKTLAALRQLGDVTDEKISTQDVSKDYADLETRVAVKEQTVARLRALIETRTAKLADVVEVERELARAVTELEEMKGSRRYYDQQIALSTITLSLVDDGSSGDAAWTVPIREALDNSLDVLGRSFSSVIYLVTFLLPWALIGLPVWWGVQRVRAAKRPDKP